MVKLVSVSRREVAIVVLLPFTLGFAGQTGTNRNFMRDELGARLKRREIWSDEKCLQGHKR